MKKQLVWFLALCGIGLLSIPLIIGHIIKDKYLKTLILLNKQLPASVQVSLESYQRGYKTSTAKIVCHILNSQISYVDKIEHGPFVETQHGTQWHLAAIRSMPTSALKTLTSTKNFYAETLLSFDNHWQTAFKSPKQHWQEEGNLFFSGGITSEVAFNAATQNLRFTIDISQLACKYRDFKFILEHLQSDGKIYNRDLLLGTLTTTLSKSIFQQGAHVLFQIQQGEFQSILKEEYPRVHLEQKIAFDKLAHGAHTYQQGRLHMHLQNIDADVAADIQDFIWQSPKNYQQIPQILWHNKLDALLAHQPVLRFDNTEINTSVGKIILSGKITTEQEQAHLRTQSTLSGVVQGHLFIRVPHQIINQLLRERLKKELQAERTQYILSYEDQKVPLPYNLEYHNEDMELSRRVSAKLTHLIEQKVLRTQRDSYQLELTYRQQKLYLNGVTFNIENFMKILKESKLGIPF